MAHAPKTLVPARQLCFTLILVILGAASASCSVVAHSVAYSVGSRIQAHTDYVMASAEGHIHQSFLDAQEVERARRRPSRVHPSGLVRFPAGALEEVEPPRGAQKTAPTSTGAWVPQARDNERPPSER